MSELASESGIESTRSVGRAERGHSASELASESGIESTRSVGRAERGRALSRESPRIAIVGAGLGGLAAAAALRRHGFGVTVYEQAERFTRIGSGINVSPNATVALRGLGLLDAMRDLACQPATWRSCTHTGELLAELPLGEAVEQAYGGPFLQMHRADYHAVLAAAVPEELVRRGRRLTGLEPAGAGYRLVFADGPPAEADAVIGADGVHSRVREVLFGREEANFTGRVAYRGVLPADRVAVAGLPHFTKWWGPDRHIVTYFINGGRELYYVTSVPEPEWRTESWSTRGEPDQLRAAFEDFHPAVAAVLDACEVTYKWALYDRDPLPRWGEGPVVLLGDSCHPMTPYMAQGAAMAMEDAVVLARCLAAGGDPAPAFARYQRTRRERAAQAQVESRRNRFLRDASSSPDWVYGYDAWTAPLAQEG